MYRDGFLCKVRILDGDNQPVPPEEYEVVERIESAEGRPDSKLPPLLWVRRELCCPPCQDQSSLWRTAERRQLPRRSWQAVLCSDCYRRLVRRRRAEVKRNEPNSRGERKCTGTRT